MEKVGYILLGNTNNFSSRSQPLREKRTQRRSGHLARKRDIDKKPINVKCLMKTLFSYDDYSPTCFKFLNNSLREFPAFMLVDITSFAKDFELPGLPTTNNGIRNSVQIAIIKTFSLKAIFLAIFCPSCTSFKNPR